MASDHKHHFVFYYYDPSLVAAIVFAVLFGLTTAVHVVQMIRFRSWFFTAMIVGGLFEVVGYIGRAFSAEDKNALVPYIVQSLLLLVAPPLFAATIYMILGRLVTAVKGERSSIIPVRWLTKIFVGGDVLSFLMQAAGGGLQATKKVSTVDAGKDLVLAGLFVQLVWFGFFVVVAAIFQYRFSSRAGDANGVPWKRHMYVLYASSALILIRSIYRVVEYAQGYGGYLFRHEVFIYVFDGALMFLVMFLFNVVHFGSVHKRQLRKIESLKQQEYRMSARGEV